PIRVFTPKCGKITLLRIVLRLVQSGQAMCRTYRPTVMRTSPSLLLQRRAAWSHGCQDEMKTVSRPRNQLPPKKRRNRPTSVSHYTFDEVLGTASTRSELVDVRKRRELGWYSNRTAECCQYPDPDPDQEIAYNSRLA